ncbi:MAG: hypothetical protein ABJL64_20140 [Rhizobiaceae bacterium]
MAEVARSRGFRLDVILPFLREDYVEAQGFSAEAKATFHKLLSDPKTHSILELDGDLNNQHSASLGYLAAGRRVAAHSDILIAVWNGEREDGTGGTAQIAREAIERGVPVVWIRLDGDACLVTDPLNLASFDGSITTLKHGDSFSKHLGQIVRDILAPPGIKGEAGLRLQRFLKEPHRTGSYWSCYDLMRWILTRRSYRMRLDYSVDRATENAWRRYHMCAENIGGGDFSAALRLKLDARWRLADNVALHCSHAYRSSYILNFVLAGFAVLVGLVSVFWWTAESSVEVKASCVGVEVALIYFILRLTRRGDRTHEDWHVRWLEARSVAELLRSARLLSLVGSAVAPQSKLGPGGEDAWVEWYVRATLREIGPPTGRLDAEAIRAAIASTIDDEITGQIDYNRIAKTSYHEIDHKLHVWGEWLFKATFFVGLTYILAALVYLVGDTFHLFHVEPAQKNLFKAVVTVLGAGLPAFGAAFFGIRATGDYKLVCEQAGRTLNELENLRGLLKAEIAKEFPTREHVSRLLYQLTQILVSDIRDWSRVYRARELQLPG